ncbi:MAG: GAF domain-containing protein [Streptosporangiales bacterium]|nr:GAF domain-containing protein [Streptosporangiales bacterium]
MTGGDLTGGARALFRLLELLAEEASPEEFGRPAGALRGDGASPGEVAAVDAAAALALRVRGALDQHRRRAAELSALFDTAGDLAALRDLDAVLRAIVHRARTLLGTDVAYLTVPDPARGDTYMRVTDGSVSALFQRVRLGLGEGLGGLVWQTAHPYATPDYAHDARFNHVGSIDRAVLDEGLVAILGVPLQVGTEVIGVLFAADRSTRDFSPEEVALLCSLAAHAAIAIDGAQLLAETRATVVELHAANTTIKAHSAAMQRAEEAHDRLTDIVVRGGDVRDVARAVADLLAGGIVCLDVDGTELARAGEVEGLPEASVLAESRRLGRALFAGDLWVCAVLAGTEPLGCLILGGRPDLGDADRRLFERSAVVTSLLLLLRRSVAEAENRIRGELLSDLLRPGGDPEHLAVRARRLGLDLDRPHVVLAAHTGAVPRGRLASAAVPLVFGGRGLSAEHEDGVAVLLAAEDPSAAARCAAAELGAAVGGPVTVGGGGPVALGPPASGAGGVAGAYAEALRCRDGLRALGRAGDGAGPADLGFLGVLLGERRDARGFVRATIGPLIDYDAERGTELVATLEAYFAAGASLTRAKAGLHVHVNTVTQRLERVAKLLGDDWNTPDRALEIQLALRLSHLVP